MLHHASAFASDFVGQLDYWATATLARGYLGVDFFFILSGFIIFYTNRGKTEAPGWSRRYAETRLVRIYVPYLPVGIAVALGYTLLPGLSASPRDWGWFGTLTLLPSNTDTALIVAWTLRHELVFYAIFWLAFWLNRPRLVFVTWTLMMVAVAALWSPMPPAAFQLLGWINVEFLMGVMVVLAVGTRLPNWPFVAAAAALLILFVWLGATPRDRILFAASLAALLVPLVRLENLGRLSAGPTLVLLGNASYAIYLVHNPLMALLARLPPAGPLIAFAWFAAAGTALGLAYHLWFEKPAIGVTRRALARWHDRRHAGAT